MPVFERRGRFESLDAAGFIERDVRAALDSKLCIPWCLSVTYQNQGRFHAGATARAKALPILWTSNKLRR
jgi:hypothetical protein